MITEISSSTGSSEIPAPSTSPFSSEVSPSIFASSAAAGAGAAAAGAAGGAAAAGAAAAGAAVAGAAGAAAGEQLGQLGYPEK